MSIHVRENSTSRHADREMLVLDAATAMSNFEAPSSG
jgi:hypothetical protein